MHKALDLGQRGYFTLTDAPVPPSAAAPRGENLVVVTNATTGHVLNIALTPSPSSHSALGPEVASLWSSL